MHSGKVKRVDGRVTMGIMIPEIANVRGLAAKLIQYKRHIGMFDSLVLWLDIDDIHR